MTVINDERLRAALDLVDVAYKRLENRGGFVARSAQIDLSKTIAKAFLEKTPLAAEAPTGTGKTLAYLLGALACTQTSMDPSKEPIVISTATKALQQQLLSSDLPHLASAGLLKLSEVAIAKGKGNYLCLSQAEDTVSNLERAASDNDVFLDSATWDMDLDTLSPMVDAYLAGTWNGDFDQYNGPRPKSLRSIAVNSDTCTRKKCSNYSNCAYFKSRADMSNCKVIVANHDLLLMDLLTTSKGLEGVLPVSNYRVVFDEAHHLPEKAINVGSSSATLSELEQALSKLKGLQRIIKDSPRLSSLVKAGFYNESDLDKDLVAGSIRELVGVLSEYEVDEETGQRRFVRGEIPGPVRSSLEGLKRNLEPLVFALTNVGSTLREAQNIPADLTEKVNEAMRRILDVKQPGEDSLKCINDMLSSKRYAKWLYRKDLVLSLHAAPLEGAMVLEDILWKNSRVVGTVAVSATLRDLGGFDRYKRKSGFPANAVFKVLPYTFPYAESQLVVAGMRSTPKLAERRSFLPELTQKLPLAIDAKEGTLVLFPSWSMLKEFAPKLKSLFGDQAVKVQGEHTVRQLVAKHCADVDAGKGSLLMGVATLSEGLDLPGKYCTHVVIVALPFSVPSDPVEQEIAEQLGTKYFSERSLPDAMTRLTQMVGRLLRRESDRGRVTLFDRRISATSYGRQMLFSLPPFKKVIESVEN